MSGGRFAAISRTTVEQVAVGLPLVICRSPWYDSITHPSPGQAHLAVGDFLLTQPGHYFAVYITDFERSMELMSVGVAPDRCIPRDMPHNFNTNAVVGKSVSLGCSAPMEHLSLRHGSTAQWCQDTVRWQEGDTVVVTISRGFQGRGHEPALTFAVNGEVVGESWVHTFELPLRPVCLVPRYCSVTMMEAQGKWATSDGPEPVE